MPRNVELMPILNIPTEDGDTRSTLKQLAAKERKTMGQLVYEALSAVHPKHFPPLPETPRKKRKA